MKSVVEGRYEVAHVASSERRERVAGEAVTVAGGVVRRPPLGVLEKALDDRRGRVESAAWPLDARRAQAEFGRLDVWVNDASVYVAGSFEETPSVAFRRTMEVNVLGYANGARAALPHFRRQGSGVLINVASVLGSECVSFWAGVPQPGVSSEQARTWLLDGVQRVAEYGASKEVTVALEPEPGMAVADLDEFAAWAPAQLPLALDTGHCLVTGERDPAVRRSVGHPVGAVPDGHVLDGGRRLACARRRRM